MYYRRGFGFGGASPPWPYVGRGRGGLPRCWCPGVVANPPYTFGPVSYSSPVSPEQELNLVKEEANTIKEHLDDVEAKIKELEGKEK